MTPLRVLVASHNWPRFPGDPAGAFAASLAAGVEARGIEVHAVVPHAAGAPLAEAAGGVHVHRFRYAPDALERVAYTGRLHSGALRDPVRLAVLPCFLLAFRRALRAHVQALRPDVIHAHWWLPAGWLASRTAVPLVVTCHGSDVRLLESRPVLRPLARRALRRARAVTAVSGYLARILERRAGPLTPPPAVQPMPVDLARFAAGAATAKVEPPRILYAGNLLASKGVDVLVRAVGRLHREGVPCRLRILGEGPEREPLEALAASEGIAPLVSWSGFLPQDRMPAEYGAATVTVLPTRGQAEGLGLVLVEALVAGSAVVGSPAGGIPEVVADGETGLLFRDGDHGHLATQLGRLLGDPALRGRLTATGAARMRARHEPAGVAEAFLGIYRDAARR